MKLLVVAAGEPLYSETATEVSIADESASEFVVVNQPDRVAPGSIAISPEEWPAIRAAIDRMIGECE